MPAVRASGLLSVAPSGEGVPTPRSPLSRALPLLLPRTRATYRRAAPQQAPLATGAGSGKVVETRAAVRGAVAATLVANAVVAAGVPHAQEGPAVVEAAARPAPHAALLAVLVPVPVVLANGVLAVVAPAATGVGPPAPERAGHEGLEGGVVRPVAALGRLERVVPADAPAGAHEGAGLSEVAVPPILEFLQVVAGAALILPVAAPPVCPSRAATALRVLIQAVERDVPAAASATGAKAGAGRVDGRQVVGAAPRRVRLAGVPPTVVPVGVALAGARPVLVGAKVVEGHAVLSPVAEVAAAAAQGPLGPPDAPLGVAAEAGVAPGPAPVTPVGWLRQAADGPVVQAALPAGEAGVHTTEVARLTPQAAARAEGWSVLGPHAPVVGGAAVRRDAHDAPVAPVLVAVVGVPHAAAHDAVPAVPLPTAGPDADRLPPLAAVPTEAAAPEVDGVPRFLPAAPGLGPVRLQRVPHAPPYASVGPLGHAPAARAETPAPVGRLALRAGGVAPGRRGAGVPPVARPLLRAVVR